MKGDIQNRNERQPEQGQDNRQMPNALVTHSPNTMPPTLEYRRGIQKCKDCPSYFVRKRACPDNQTGGCQTSPDNLASHLPGRSIDRAAQSSQKGLAGGANDLQRSPSASVTPEARVVVPGAALRRGSSRLREYEQSGSAPSIGSSIDAKAHPLPQLLVASLTTAHRTLPILPLAAHLAKHRTHDAGAGHQAVALAV